MALAAADKLAIQELLGRAAYGYDERDMDMLASCFASDASLTMRVAGGELIGPFEGRESILGLMRDSMARQGDVRRHVVSNIFFLEEGARPVVVSNLTLLATGSGETALLSAGVYRDTVARAGAGWQLARRHIDLDSPY